jgi:hypothetical protein
MSMTGVLKGRVLKLDVWSEPGRFQIATGGASLRTCRVGDTVDIVMLGDSCKQRYSTVYVTAVVRRIDRDDTNEGTTAVVKDPGGRRIFVPLRGDRVFSMEPVSWTFDEIVGTTVRDASVQTGHFNIQLRRRYDARKFVGREYVVFPSKHDARPHEVFTYACKF